MMKSFLILSISIICFSFSDNKQYFDQKAGQLRLAIDKTGKITALEDVTRGINYLASEKVSYLMGCKKYTDNGSSDALYPEKMKIIGQSKAGTKVELSFGEGVKLRVLITPKAEYFRMELIGAEPVSEIDQIMWGPFNSTMQGVIGDIVGIARSGNFSLGLMSLEPNTDGGASYSSKGSLLRMSAFDQTRGRFRGGKAHLRMSVPIPGLTVTGSAVALYGCAAGMANELAIIGKIELEEGLPHPTLNGEWIKTSGETRKLGIWTNIKEKNLNECLPIAKEMEAGVLCRKAGFFKSWGHFDIDTMVFPGGIKAMAENSKHAKKEGVGLSIYTLSTFIKPYAAPEPYLTPIPDDRLVSWKPQTKLTKSISESDTEIRLQKSPELVEVFNSADKVIRVDNELIEFRSFSEEGNEIVAKGCRRGAFFSIAASHPKESNVKLMFVSGFHNFYPKTLDLTLAISNRFWEIISQADLLYYMADGVESCDEMGYGNYGRNVFLKNMTDKCAANKKDLLTTTSDWSHYSWHSISCISWGECDYERGFRGSALDSRIPCQVMLRNNLMPNKLGQYYPENANASDIEWLMGLSVGWGAGFDFEFNNIKVMKSKPDYERMVEIMQLWNQALRENAFTEEQKMALRQTDVQYKLSRKTDGGWDLKFNGFWHNTGVTKLPPSAIAAKALNGGATSVMPCSIDRSWTHYPAACDEVGLSDDLIHRAGNSETSWTVNYPAYTELTKKTWFPTNDRYFQFVIRLPKDASCAVKNLKVSVNEKVVDLPITLQPGQYLSIPHNTEWACVYNEKHEVISELFFRGNLPKVEKGSTATVTLSCEPLDTNQNPEVIMNVHHKNGFHYW
jgi:hypothetical protein